MKKLALLILIGLVNSGCANMSKWDWNTRGESRPNSSEEIRQSARAMTAKAELSDPIMAKKFKNVVPDDVIYVRVLDH